MFQSQVDLCAGGWMFDPTSQLFSCYDEPVF